MSEPTVVYAGALRSAESLLALSDYGRLHREIGIIRADIMRLITFLSLILNLGLLLWLLRPFPAAPVPGTFGNSSRPERVGRSVDKSTEVELAHSPEAVAELDWRKIESADYRQYIANLRAAGCPEPVIRDIALLVVHKDFLPRARTITRRIWTMSIGRNPRRFMSPLPKSQRN